MRAQPLFVLSEERAAPRLRACLAERGIDLADELGRGGTSVVYRATDRKHARPVVVKVLRPEVSAALGRISFLREIQFAAVLRHPHLLPLYDSGAVDDTLFYVMPYIDGESLRQRLTRSGRLRSTRRSASRRRWRMHSRRRTSRGSCTAISNPRTSCLSQGTRSSPTLEWVWP